MEEDFNEDLGRAEMGAWERVSFGPIVGTKQRLQDIQNPLEKFKVITNAICRGMNDENIIKLTEADITNIIQKADVIPNIEYKNPTAFILAYLVTNGGNEINKTVLKNLTKKLPQIPDIQEPDIIRYSRLIISASN